ncbi:hypothetical protein N2488_10025 [SAR92 clade bacterium H231]|nr:hypothetical protein [SAR92 clade bacterium H231]
MLSKSLVQNDTVFPQWIDNTPCFWYEHNDKFDDKDALTLVKQGAADYFNIKLGKAGGIYTGLKINTIAEAAGCKCMIGCFGESRLALSAAAHMAHARPNICFLDLDSAFDFCFDPVMGGIRYDEQQGGVIHLPETPGHGASFDESALAARVIISREPE